MSNVKQQIRDAMVTGLAAESITAVVAPEDMETAHTGSRIRHAIALGDDSRVSDGAVLAPTASVYRELAVTVRVTYASGETPETVENALLTEEVKIVRALTQTAGVLALVKRVSWESSEPMELGGATKATLGRLTCHFRVMYEITESDLETAL